MSKFHVGDEVRFTGGDGVPEKFNNKVATVINIETDGTYYLKFAVDEKWWASVNHLRPADIFAQADEDLSAIQQAVDNVNHPPHYNRFPVEVIEITEQLDFNKGNAVKYILRAGHKAGVDELEDLSKAAWYVNRAIEKLKKERES
jgi:predicted DNA-binding protein